MEHFERWSTRLAQLLKICLTLSLAILGIFLLIVLFIELGSLIQEFFSSRPSMNLYFDLLDGMIVFFLFFEFTAMIVSALKHHGHISVNFLMSLGVTALLRGMIVEHENAVSVLLSAIAILLLIGGMILVNYLLRHIEEEHLAHWKNDQ